MKKMVCVAVIGVFLAIAALPAAAAQDDEPSFESLQNEVRDVGDITVTVGSKALTISWQGIEVGPNASAWLREKVDGITGDEDSPGVITSDEAEAAQSLIRMFIKKEFDSYAHDTEVASPLLIDTVRPQAITIPENGVAATGVEGPVHSEDGITLSFVVVVGFPTHDADVHTVRLDMGKYYFRAVDEEKAAEVVGDFSLTIKAADGWSIDPSTIQAGNCGADQYDADAKAMIYTTQDVNCFTEKSGVLMSFSITGHDDKGFSMPGFEGVFMAAGLLGAAWTLRRRA